MARPSGERQVNSLQSILNDLVDLATVRPVHLERRAEIHAALGDPRRLAIVDELRRSDRSPGELAARLDISPPLTAFHLDHLERVGLVERFASTGDGRRRYVRLVTCDLDRVARPAPDPAPSGRVVFVCTHNSARSQLAAALWQQRLGPATSAGTEPADEVHPGAIAAARRAGLDLSAARPRRVSSDDLTADVITVCDHAHERLPAGTPTRHWSVPDPVADGRDTAFDRALHLLAERISAFVPREQP